MRQEDADFTNGRYFECGGLPPAAATFVLLNQEPGGHAEEDQEAAHAYKAACTPDLFLFDGNQELYYRGQFDSARPKNDIEPTGEDLRDATDRLLAGEPAPEKQIPSMGCNIKWKKGKQPNYAG